MEAAAKNAREIQTMGQQKPCKVNAIATDSLPNSLQQRTILNALSAWEPDMMPQCVDSGQPNAITAKN